MGSSSSFIGCCCTSINVMSNITFSINVVDKVSNKDEDYMTKCANKNCSYYFYYMGRSEYCESCRGLK